jgi:hypothetical protein
MGKEKREAYRAACQEWCRENKIQLSIVENAYVSEEKPNV